LTVVVSILSQVKHERLWELLYCEANQNVVDGHYVLLTEDYNSLAGIQACIEMGEFLNTRTEQDYR